MSLQCGVLFHVMVICFGLIYPINVSDALCRQEGKQRRCCVELCCIWMLFRDELGPVGVCKIMSSQV